jgi:hypothetical protein
VLVLKADLLPPALHRRAELTRSKKVGAFRATEASDGDNDQLAWQAELA